MLHLCHPYLPTISCLCDAAAALHCRSRLVVSADPGRLSPPRLAVLQEGEGDTEPTAITDHAVTAGQLLGQYRGDIRHSE